MKRAGWICNFSINCKFTDYFLALNPLSLQTSRCLPRANFSMSAQGATKRPDCSFRTRPYRFIIQAPSAQGGNRGRRHSPRISWRSLGSLAVKTHLFVSRGRDLSQLGYTERSPCGKARLPAQRAVLCKSFFHLILLYDSAPWGRPSIPETQFLHLWNRHTAVTPDPTPPPPQPYYRTETVFVENSFWEERDNRTESHDLIFCNGFKLHTRFQILKVIPCSDESAR